jgi:hypothetical protein
VRDPRETRGVRQAADLGLGARQGALDARDLARHAQERPRHLERGAGVRRDLADARRAQLLARGLARILFFVEARALAFAPLDRRSRGLAVAPRSLTALVLGGR